MRKKRVSCFGAFLFRPSQDSRDLKQRGRRDDDAVNENEQYQIAFIRWRSKGIVGRPSPSWGLMTILAVHLKITICFSRD